VGLDGSAYSAAAVELGIRWAQRSGAVLIGLGMIDAPTICKPQPVPLGGSAYKVHHDAAVLAEAHHTVARQEVGAPAACLLLEAAQ
jgi:hypothetical protein